MSVWTVSTEEICRLQSHDQEMTEIMNQLLGESTARALPPAALRHNLKTQAPDGGIDAVVDGSLPPERDTMGLFADPIGWQFKASPSDHIKPPQRQKGGQERALQLEIQKPYARADRQGLRVSLLHYGFSSPYYDRKMGKLVAG